jgi:hypothetical protein
MVEDDPFPPRRRTQVISTDLHDVAGLPAVGGTRRGGRPARGVGEVARVQVADVCLEAFVSGGQRGRARVGVALDAGHVGVPSMAAASLRTTSPATSRKSHTRQPSPASAWVAGWGWSGCREMHGGVGGTADGQHDNGDWCGQSESLRRGRARRNARPDARGMKMLRSVMGGLTHGEPAQLAHGGLSRGP